MITCGGHPPRGAFIPTYRHPTTSHNVSVSMLTHVTPHPPPPLPTVTDIGYSRVTPDTSTQPTTPNTQPGTRFTQDPSNPLNWTMTLRVTLPPTEINPPIIPAADRPHHVDTPQQQHPMMIHDRELHDRSRSTHCIELPSPPPLGQFDVLAVGGDGEAPSVDAGVVRLEPPSVGGVDFVPELAGSVLLYREVVVAGIGGVVS